MLNRILLTVKHVYVSSLFCRCYRTMKIIVTNRNQYDNDVLFLMTQSCGNQAGMSTLIGSIKHNLEQIPMQQQHYEIE